MSPDETKDGSGRRRCLIVMDEDRGFCVQDADTGELLNDKLEGVTVRFDTEGNHIQTLLHWRDAVKVVPPQVGRGG